LAKARFINYLAEGKRRDAMTKTIIGSAILIVTCSLAYAVSLEFKVYPALSIGEVTTTTSEDGLNTETQIEFSGAGLKPFMALLPEAKDGENGNKVSKTVRMLQITNVGQPGVAPDKVTSIYIDCVTDKKKVPTCHINIEKGPPPG
jgi:hypothetical protein